MTNSFSGRILQIESFREFDQRFLAEKYLTLDKFDDALQDITTGTITLPDFGKYSTDKPANQPINANGQPITNLPTVNLGDGISGILSSAVSIGVATQMFPNTGPQNFTNQVSMNNKVVSAADPEPILIANTDETEAERTRKGKHLVTQKFMREVALVQNLRRGDDFALVNQPSVLPWDASTTSAMTMNARDAVNIQGVADPVFQYDAVNKRTLDEEVKGCHQRDADIDVQDQYRLINLPEPLFGHHGVNKTYCDANSRSGDGSGALVGALAGAVSGAVAAALVAKAGAGLAAIGPLVSGLLSSGIAVGTSADLLSKGVPGIGASDQLIQDAATDALNSGVDTGTIANSAMTVTGMFRAVKNASIGLFDVV